MDLRLIGRWQSYQYETKKGGKPRQDALGQGDLLRILPNWTVQLASFDEVGKLLEDKPWDVDETVYTVSLTKEQTVISAAGIPKFIVTSITSDELRLCHTNGRLEHSLSVWYRRLPDKI